MWDLCQFWIVYSYGVIKRCDRCVSSISSTRSVLSYTMCKSNLDPMRIASRLLKVAFFAKFNEIYPERDTEKCVSSIAGLLGLMLCEYFGFLNVWNDAIKLWYLNGTTGFSNSVCFLKFF